MRCLLLRISLVFCLFLPTSLAQTNGPTGLPQGVTREQMWPAPSTDDWKKPCLITFQRSYDDALAISKETGKPILVCVNMDGEIASEHYAGVRYRQPDIAKLYEPYVCVIASVYRHTPRDYDETGRRVLCPRFGSVTCGEHIAIEPILFEKFFEGRRVAPRHIAVELDGKESYDVFYAWDTDTVFNAIRDGAKNRPEPKTIVRGDRPIQERVASRDIEDRNAVEQAYQQGDSSLKKALLEAANIHPEAAPVDLLRLALNGLDPDLNRLARQVLAKTDSNNAVDLIAEVLRVPMEEVDRKALLTGLEKMAENSPRARTLATVHRGMSSRSESVSSENWAKLLDGNTEKPTERGSAELNNQLEILDQNYTARPEDSSSPLDRAETTLSLAINPQTSRKQSRILFLDAHRDALEAEKLGATGWRVNAAIAVAEFNLGRNEEAYRRAEQAVKSMPQDAQSWNSMAVLSIFAEARQRGIIKAFREKQTWPPEWLADVNATYSVLAKHPHGTDVQVVSHYDFLRWIGGLSQANQALDQGLKRFPDSVLLHDRLRRRALEEKGPAGLEAAYETRLREKDAPAILEWFAGYASLVAAEFHRRANRIDDAHAAYERGIAHYERCIESKAGNRETADHYIALAFAGRARIAFERGEYETALHETLKSFDRKPDAAASQDGLNISPVDTAKMLLSKLRANKSVELATKLESALKKLDPAMLQLPAYEKEQPPEKNQ